METFRKDFKQKKNEIESSIISQEIEAILKDIFQSWSIENSEELLKMYSSCTFP